MLNIEEYKKTGYQLVKGLFEPEVVDNIKKEVQNHPSDMDLQEFWEQVAPKKKKRYPIWLILLPIILASTGYFLLQNHSSSPLLEKQEKNICLI